MTATGRRRLFLMRHGHVDYFAPGLEDPRTVPLTETGRRQAQACRDALRQVAFDAAITSGLRRARETAEIVLTLHPEAPAIRDVPDFEELQSGFIRAGTREELAARLAFAFDDAAEAGARFLPDGESFAAAEARVVAGIERLVRDHRWSSALLVAHEGVNRIILGWACGAGLGAIGAFEQDLCCINVIDLDVTPSAKGAGVAVERAILKAVNLTPYDYAKSGLPRTSLEHLFEVDFGRARPPRR